MKKSIYIYIYSDRILITEKKGGEIVKKIYVISVALVILMIAMSTTAFASEELVAHDFGDFKMNIPESSDEITEQQGDGNQTLYSIPNTDLSVFCIVEYWDTSNIDSNNTTAFILNKVKANNTVETEGNISSWADEDGINTRYLISSEDDTKCIILVGSDKRMQDAIDSIEFK